MSLSVFDIIYSCESKKQAVIFFFLWKCWFAVDNQNFEERKHSLYKSSWKFSPIFFSQLKANHL